MGCRDAFGRLIAPLEELTFPERVDVYRRLAGRLQASNSIEDQRVGARFTTWLHAGGDLLEVLGLRPVKGSTVTAQSLVRETERNALIRRLVVAVGGSKAKAARVLRGEEPAPARATALLTQLQAMGRPPRSRRTVMRACAPRADRRGGAL